MLPGLNYVLPIYALAPRMLREFEGTLTKLHYVLL
jgi:hypothetical protein